MIVPLQPEVRARHPNSGATRTGAASDPTRQTPSALPKLCAASQILPKGCRSTSLELERQEGRTTSLRPSSQPASIGLLAAFRT